MAPLHRKLKVRRIDEYTSLLAISYLETEHAGNYSCVATNSVAEYVRSAVLTIRGKSFTFDFILFYALKVINRYYFRQAKNIKIENHYFHGPIYFDMQLLYHKSLCKLHREANQKN